MRVGLVAGDGGVAIWPLVLGPAVLAGGVNFMVNSSLVAAAVTLEGRSRLPEVWRENFMWLTPHYLVLSFLGLAMASAHSAMGFWGLFGILAIVSLVAFTKILGTIARRGSGGDVPPP